MSEEINYKVIEVEAENIHVKDELIETQKKLIEFLEGKVKYLEGLLTEKYSETDAGSNMIAPPNFQVRPRMRTMTEVSSFLEERSRKIMDAPKSAEEVQNEKI